MNYNDIIRRLRYTFDLSDSKMIDIFALGGEKVTRALISDWLKRDEDPAFIEILDKELAVFLNGLIIKNRGSKDGEIPVAEDRLNNNIIFRKLKIALNYKDDDILDLMKSVHFNLSRHELSAFFRKPFQPQFRNCLDQVLRNFLMAMQLKYRGNSTEGAHNDEYVQPEVKAS
jgi:uncharacterized protein YehS (DUF1456 family)